jgi:hypothetical protein
MGELDPPEVVHGAKLAASSPSAQGLRDIATQQTRDGDSINSIDSLLMASWGVSCRLSG